MKKDDKEEYRRLLEEIGEDYCPRGTYCIFKEFLVSAHPSRRLLVQLKCMDKRKYIISKDFGYDVGWPATMKAWIEDGHAKKFAEVYNDRRCVEKIFKMIIPDETVVQGELKEVK